MGTKVEQLTGRCVQYGSDRFGGLIVAPFKYVMAAAAALPHDRYYEPTRLLRNALGDFFSSASN